MMLPTLAAIETAIAFWGLLLPAGQRGQALRHMDMITDALTGDVIYQPSKEPGWKPEHNALWFEYLNEKAGKGISKDTWLMVSDVSNCSYASMLVFLDSICRPRAVLVLRLSAHNRRQVPKARSRWSVYSPCFSSRLSLLTLSFEQRPGRQPSTTLQNGRKNA